MGAFFKPPLEVGVGDYQLTKENYLQYIKKELEFYTSYDYVSINNQEDYEDDFYAEALLNEELAGVSSIDLMDSQKTMLELENATIINKQYEEADGILCTGISQVESGGETDRGEYMTSVGLLGAKFEVKDVDDYKYLVFYGKKNSYKGQPLVYVYDGEGNKIAELEENYQNIDNEWQRHVIDISKTEGNMTIYFSGGYIDDVDDENSAYCFSKIKLY